VPTVEAAVAPAAGPLALYPRLLGAEWPRLGEPVRRLHRGASGRHRGTFTVTRGTGRLARLVAALLGLPAAGEAVPVVLELAEDAGTERWRRTFAGRAVVTAQSARGPLLVERFGSMECLFRLEAREGALVFVQVGAALRLGPLVLPLPRWGWPRVRGWAGPAGDRVRVEVSIAAPVVGLLVDYRGEIAAEGAP
jgi:hypothetical protein